MRNFGSFYFNSSVCKWDQFGSLRVWQFLEYACGAYLNREK
jgi:hypothetical protein